MSRDATRHAKTGKTGGSTLDALTHAAVGLEAEFTLVVDDRPVRPEALFGDPRGFIHLPLMHRLGTSYHLPNSAAVYFDTGVIEIATAAMELERGCVARAGRSLWESIGLLRTELDRWERQTGSRSRLTGFSTHYNTSLALSERTITPGRLNRLARTLTYVLPVPVMLLGTNRRSTGVGVRPRRHRLEVTADFTPDPALMIATGSLIVGIIREMITGPQPTPESVGRELPVILGFSPMAHTSRRGWLARFDRFPSNPFASDIDSAEWETTAGRLSLRDIGRRIFERFRRPIARVADPFSLRLMASIFRGGAASLLSLQDRPPAYEDVGRLPAGHGPELGQLKRSRYERALMSAVCGRPLRLFGAPCTPVRVRGWSRVVFRRDEDGTELVIPIDLLVDRLDEWERGESPSTDGTPEKRAGRV